MKIQEASNIFMNHQRATVKPKTLRSYNYLLSRFNSQFTDRLLESIRPEEAYQFLETWLLAHRAAP